MQLRKLYHLCLIFVSILLIASVADAADDGYSWWSAVWESGTRQARIIRKSFPSDEFGCRVLPGKVPNAGAWAGYSQTVNTTGWAKISVVSNPDGFSDEEQAYLAGCLEGVLTQQLIYNSWSSLLWANYGDSMKIPDGVAKWMNENDEWTLQQIEANQGSNFWDHVGLLYTQMSGLIDGYNLASAPSQKLSRLAFLMMSGDGDLGDINSIAVEASLRPEQARSHRQRKGDHDQNYGTHCSALLKLTDDYGELFAGHTTWASYAYMLRLYKFYTLNFQTVSQASTQVQFAGYPGTMTSVDDWYLTFPARLMVTETTNGYYNTSLNSILTPASLLSWIRAGVATRISNSGSEWAQYFAMYNSGTYNNQWMVVDYKLFTPFKAPLMDGLLWVAEQMPGKVRSADKTHVLALGYWPSYNVPYFKDIYVESGFAEMSQRNIGYSWELAPRAKIFRRDHHMVQTLPDMLKIMRYNDYTHDPFSQGSPMRTISSRADLPRFDNSTKPHKLRPFGGIDSKVTSFALMQQMTTLAQNGPTHDQVPPFYWAQYPLVPREGQPDVFNFDYEEMSA